jgi:hypothetical protein
MARRHNWLPGQVDATEDGFVEELMLAEAGYDQAVAALQQRKQAKSGGKRALYGHGGMAG